MKLYSRSTYINKKLYSLPRLTSSKRFHDIFDPDQSAICSLIVGYCFVCVRRHNLSCCYRSIPSTRVLGEINNVDQTYWLCYDSTCHFLIFNCRIHDQVRADSLICRNAVTWRSSLSNDERVTVDRATYNGTYNQKGHCVKVIKCERQFSLHCK